MTSIKRYTHLAILRGKHPRIRAAPTQFLNFGKIFKIEFPGNWTKILISSESAWFSESFLIFWIKKIAHRKKLSLFLIPEFNLYIRHLLWFICMTHSVIFLVTCGLDSQLPCDVRANGVSLYSTGSFLWGHSRLWMIFKMNFKITLSSNNDDLKAFCKLFWNQP